MLKWRACCGHSRKLDCGARISEEERYCFGILARSITAAHLPISAARRAFNSSGVLALA